MKKSILLLHNKENQLTTQNPITELTQISQKTQEPTLSISVPVEFLHKAVTRLDEKLENRFDTIDESLEVIKNHVIKKPKPKSVKLPRRDPLHKQFFLGMLKQPKRPHEKLLSYSRFRVAITLLFLTGLRVNEIRQFTRADIESLFLGNGLNIYQSKVHAYRRLVLGPKSRKLYPVIEPNLRDIYYKSDTLGGNLNENSWITFMNERIRKYAREHDISGVFTSHSFRIHFVTNLLQQRSLHEVQHLVGHTDVRTTENYNRFKPTDTFLGQSIDSLLDQKPL